MRAVNYDFKTDKADGEFSNYAYLASDDGSPLANGVTSLTVNFGSQENGYVGYAEIEIIGEIDASLPRLAGCAPTARVLNRLGGAVEESRHRGIMVRQASLAELVN